MGTTRALSCLQIPSFPLWSRDNTLCLQAPALLLQRGISGGFGTNFETLLWNKEEFLGMEPSQEQAEPCGGIFGNAGGGFGYPKLQAPAGMAAENL